MKKTVIIISLLLTVTMIANADPISKLEKYNGWVLQSAIRVVNIGGLENGIIDSFPANSPRRVIQIIQGDFIYQIMIGRNEDVAPYNVGIFTVERLNAFIVSKQQMILKE